MWWGRRQAGTVDEWEEGGGKTGTRDPYDDERWRMQPGGIPTFTRPFLGTIIHFTSSHVDPYLPLGRNRLADFSVTVQKRHSLGSIPDPPTLK